MKAVKALQAHLASKKESSTGKQNLLEGDSDDEDAEEFSGAGAADPDMALWLQVTTKKFITDQKRLKPSKMYVNFLLKRYWCFLDLDIFTIFKPQMLVIHTLTLL